MDEPLALIKKPRPEPEKAESQSKATTVKQIQVINTTVKWLWHVLHQNIMFILFIIIKNNTKMLLFIKNI